MVVVEEDKEMQDKVVVEEEVQGKEVGPLKAKVKNM